ncbi:MAG TPA: iron-containing redox enzyme family protein [Spongiibacteraceae bacterium]|nr:iron-containing redox enzyme family protein [Spongiibacteraceae bacterium]
MSFFAQLNRDTELARSQLLKAPLIAGALAGDISHQEYLAFLGQAYHHVKHTVPLLMAVGARLGEDKEWLREAIVHYIEEEVGHQEWVLNDIVACGGNRDETRCARPNASTELMVAYAYDMVYRVNPLGFFGMVHVLEGTSVAVAEQAANRIRDTLGLPQQAFSYLYSHGTLDKEHVGFFADLTNRIEAPAEQALITHAANSFYRLYGDIFRELRPAARGHS